MLAFDTYSVVHFEGNIRLDCITACSKHIQLRRRRHMSITILTSLFSPNQRSRGGLPSFTYPENVHRSDNSTNSRPGLRIYSLREYVQGRSVQKHQPEGVCQNWRLDGKREMPRRRNRLVSPPRFTRCLSNWDRSQNPLEMGTVSAASLAAFFLKRRDSVALGIYGDGLAYLPPDTGDKQYFKI